MSVEKGNVSTDNLEKKQKENLQEDFPYADIIELPHHVSDKHPQMSLYDRSAQFAPFAALTGHDEAIEETARLTEEKMELNEDQKGMIDGYLQMIRENLKAHPKITVTYFVKDEKKSGGAYVTKTGRVSGMDYNLPTIFLEDGTEILLENLYRIDSCEM